MTTASGLFSSIKVIDEFRSIATISYFDDMNADNIITNSITVDGPIEINSIELKDTGSNNSITLQAPTLSADYSLTFPVDDGTAGQLLSTDGSGVLSWVAGGGGTPGGANTQVQFNDGGTFGGDSDLTFNKSNNTLSVGVSTGVIDLGGSTLFTSDGGSNLYANVSANVSIRSIANDSHISLRPGSEGYISIGSGSATGSNTAYSTTIRSGGNVGTGNAGTIDIISGNAGGASGDGGNIILTAGTSASGTDGNIELITGGVTVTMSNGSLTGLVDLSNTGNTTLGNTTTDSLGFYGIGPVTQPSSTGNTSVVAAGGTTSVFNDTTFDGGSGTAYTIGDIIVALKALGLMAV